MPQPLQITKEFHFSAAHRLEGHSGKCRRLHGHNYQVEVTVQRPSVQPTGSSKGMVLDFDELSDEVQETILDVLDHRFLATDETPPNFVTALDPDEVAILPILASTAEELAGWIGRALVSNEIEDVQAIVTRVVVWETPKCFAEWSR